MVLVASVGGWLAHFHDGEVVLRVSAALLGAGQLVTSLEWLSIRGQLGAGGLYRRVGPIGSERRHRRAQLRTHLDAMTPTVALVALRLVLALAIVVEVACGAGLTVTLLGFVAVIVLGNRRLQRGLESADVLAAHVGIGLSAYGICRAAGAGGGPGLLYIAAVSGLAYVTAGVTKLMTPAWRSGEALAWVVNLQSFGSSAAAHVLIPRTRTRVTLSWLVMLAETMAPLAVLLPARLIIVALALGAVFHVSLALLMGLNTFVWSFLATYPAGLFVWAALHGVH